uniref:KIB1-4 beta-propeller domain-containing protein n=1 Tax=Oryza punctata TaxID=4537 RepID=A0A0E0JTA7_ORYPU
MGRVPAPCIALKHGAGSDKPALFSISEKTAIDAEIPGMTNSNAWPTPQGWILIRDSTTFLQNPQDPDEKIHLPHLPEAVHSRCASVLSVKPMIPGCVVLLVEPEDTIIWYCRIGQDEEWARHEYDIGTQPLIPPVNGKDHEKVPITSIAACQGKFYFNGRFDSISVLEFTPAPTFSFIAITEPLDFWGAASVLLVESESELYMVSQLFDYYLEYICDVTVHKMDFSKHQWCTAEDIGGHAFLIASRYFGASRSADECGLEKDCVYAIFARDNYFEDGNISGVSSSFGESILLLEEEKKIHDAVRCRSLLLPHPLRPEQRSFAAAAHSTAAHVDFFSGRHRSLLLPHPPRPEARSSPSAASAHSTAAHAGLEVVPRHRRSRGLPHLPQPAAAGVDIGPNRRRNQGLPHPPPPPQSTAATGHPSKVIVKRLVEMKGKYSINNNYT